MSEWYGAAFITSSEISFKGPPSESVSGLNLVRSERVKANDKTIMITKQ